MHDPAHEHVMEILADALELPADQREAFVEAACGADAACLDEVRRLLAAEHVAPQLPSLPAQQTVARSLQPPAQIGPYRIIREIGRGGMGVVYLAQQERPVRRCVAVKLIHLGMNSPEVEARFDSERQALAMMTHPNVARVFDGGTTEIGRPYFVMEYVPGEPITDWCDRNALDVRQRLELFVQVCEAVQHSHQKGIIHRDLKPGNVLITSIDGKAVPKVIDFGIAKAIEQPLTERTFFTEHGRLMGTPEYMSPEQTSLDGRDIDTRTDVYSLGVLLYQLISGTLPFDRDMMRKSRFDEIRRLIREVEPPKPSSRFSQMGASAKPIAQRRRSVPAGLVRVLRRELDWITMKAMEKEPSRRYASAAELAADVRRYLDDQPVLAGPPSTVYRMSKLVRRHRVPVAAAAIVLLALIGGIIGVMWQAVAARRAEARATQRFHDVRAIANKLLFDFDNSIMHLPGTLNARQLLVTTAREYLDKLARDSSDDVDLQNDLAIAYIGVGKIQFEPSLPHIGDRTGAIESFKKALTIARHAAAQRPEDPRLRLTLALALGRYGSTAYLEEPDASIRACEEAIGILEPLSRAPEANRVVEIDLGAVLFSLGWALSDTGKVEQGLAVRRRALEHFESLRSGRPDDMDVAMWLAATHMMLGKSLQLTGELDEALRHMQTGRELQAQLLSLALPNSVLLRRSIAIADISMAEIFAERGDLRRAAELVAAAVDAMEALARADPENVQARADFGINLHRLIALQAASDNVAAALHTFETRFWPMVQKRYPPGHAVLLRYQLEHAGLLRKAQRFGDAEDLLRACEREARSASSPILSNVFRAQVELYEAWEKPDLLAAARSKLAHSEPPTTQPQH